MRISKHLGLFLCILAGLPSLQAFADDVLWRPELIQSHGIGCRFGHSSDPSQNAFVIASGDSISFIFTQLGEEFRTGRNPNVDVSPCRIILPLEVGRGFWVEQIAQTLTYGIAKTKGVRAQLNFNSNFARRMPNGRSNANDLSQNMASAMASFPAPLVINSPLEILNQPLARIGEDRRNNSPHRRFCNRERSRLFNYHSDIFVRINKINPNASIAFAVDGLDLKYEMKLKLRKCRAL